MRAGAEGSLEVSLHYSLRTMIMRLYWVKVFVRQNVHFAINKIAN